MVGLLFAELVLKLAGDSVEPQRGSPTRLGLLVVVEARHNEVRRQAEHAGKVAGELVWVGDLI